MTNPSNRAWNYSPRRWTDETTRHHAVLYQFGSMHETLVDHLEGLIRPTATGVAKTGRHCRRWARA